MEKKSFFKQSNTGIFFAGILIVAILLRLWGITNSLSDFHHFRQTYTAMMARNFYDHSMNILFPKVNILEFNNIIEFQLYPFVVALLYKLFGFHDIIGRLVSVLSAIGSIIVLYKLVTKFTDKLAGLFTIALFAILPMMVYYTRTFMLESTMIFLSISSLYTLSNWLETDSTKNMLWSIISLACLLLIKISTAYMLLPVMILILYRFGLEAIQKWKVYAYLLLSILPSIYWYILHVRIFPELASQGGMATNNVTGGYLGKEMLNLSYELLMTPKFWSRIFLSRIGEYHLAYSGFFLLLYIVAIKVISSFRAFSLKEFISSISIKSDNSSKDLFKNNDTVFFFWLLATIIFFLMFPAPNYAHEYYQLPVIPPACALIGIFLSRVISKTLKNQNSLQRNRILIGLFFVSILPSTYIRLESRLKIDDTYEKFSHNVQKYTNKNDLILLWDIPRTEVFYFSNRYGYTTHALANNSIPEIEKFRKKGVKFFVTPYPEFALYAADIKRYLDDNYEQVLGQEARDPNFKKKLTLLLSMGKKTDGFFPGFIYRLDKKLK